MMDWSSRTPSNIYGLLAQKGFVLLTGTLRNQVDQIWNTFWTGGISNPLTVIEQISYLLFIKRLDDVQRVGERKAKKQNKALEKPVFAPDQNHLRWSVFADEADPAEMFRVVSEEVFPFIKTLGDRMGGGEETAYARFMKDAAFLVPKPSVLVSVVDLIKELEMDDRDTKGDLYEYLLSKLTQAGVNGQFRTPRHIIRMMVALVKPRPGDSICDPACGTAGFLMESGEYLREHHPEIFRDDEMKDQFNHETFHGFDFDASMLRIGAMNMMSHGVENPKIESRDTLSQAYDEKDLYSLILANPPFKGSLNYDETAPDLLKTVKTKKTELLFIALFLRILEEGGVCACIVPDGVLFGSSKAHKALREELVENQQLEAVISMPSGVFKPYAGVSTGILIFTKTDGGGTKDVWFYDMQADGFSLDDKRTPLSGGHDHNNIPDIIHRYHNRKGAEEAARTRRDQSFLVPKEEIAKQDYDLSINRYKEIVYEEVAYDPPADIIARVESLQEEIDEGLKALKEMLV